MDFSRLAQENSRLKLKLEKCEIDLQNQVESLHKTIEKLKDDMVKNQSERKNEKDKLDIKFITSHTKNEILEQDLKSRLIFIVVFIMYLIYLLNFSVIKERLEIAENSLIEKNKEINELICQIEQEKIAASKSIFVNETDIINERLEYSLKL